MQIKYSLSPEEFFSLAKQQAKNLPMVRFIHKRGIILFSAIYIALFMIFDIHFLSYENFNEMLNKTGVNIFDKGILLLLSIALGILTHRSIKSMYLSSLKNKATMRPDYLFGSREITLNDDGAVLQYQKHTLSFSWDVLEELEDKNGYYEIITPVAKDLIIPYHAFKNQEELSKFKDCFQKNRTELMSSWVQKRDGIKKQTKTRMNVNRILRISIVGFLFGPLSFVFLPFVLSMAKDEAQNIANHPEAQILSKRIKLAKFIAYFFPLLWIISCIAVVLFGFAQ